MNIDPKVSFYLGLTVSIALAIANGTIAFKGAVPDAVIPMLVSWCSIVGNIGTIVMTAIAGSNMTRSGRLAIVQQVPLPDRAADVASSPQVKAVVLKDQALAESVPSTKVIGPQDQR